MFDVGNFLGGVAGAVSNYWSAGENRASQERMAAQNIALQREFAQSGIQWKVADAKAAGLHPLAALGTQTSSFSPVSVGSSDYGSMGQDIGRAVKAAMSQEDRDAEEMKDLAKERAKLQNDVLRQELVSKQRREGGALGPPMPASTTVSPFKGGSPPVAFLTREGPARSMGGHAVQEEPMKIQEEGGMSHKKLPWYGMDVHLPNWLASGQQWEDTIGEHGGSLMGASNIPGIIGYNVYKRIPPLSSFGGGSGQRFKRFRRGGGSYRPWAD